MHCGTHLAAVVEENVRQEIHDFARLCESLLTSALNDTPPNLVECAVMSYYASSVADRCKAIIAGEDKQRPR